ncbi:UPF0175 family protein [Thermococcus barophilus]|uniref:Uncharacterized protein n=1 Tax=Thermococcus barophilus (strain DSM 11836 / MP) TaxID=391623 RepID=F0LIJ7_THEBM|nr:UPF0175 family protein [Thermococcus barophilus]ADT83271.1 hypothetical protein TERMP_00294 [Thermococcus barophilus MP]
MSEVILHLPAWIDEREARIALAVELYREGKITLKQAAEIANLCVEDFMKELSKRKVSILNWNEKELEEEIENADNF